MLKINIKSYSTNFSAYNHFHDISIEGFIDLTKSFDMKRCYFLTEDEEKILQRFNKIEKARMTDENNN
jgi:hypothetical protein